MPTLFKRSNGIYYILFREKGKARWVSTGQRQKSPALEVLMNYGRNNSPLNTEQGKPLSTPPMTLAKFIDEFMSFASTNYSAKTSQMYEATLKRLAGFLGDISLSAISGKQIDAFKVARLKSISPVSVNIELRTLRAAFYTAVRWKIISENPTKGVSMARVPDMQPSYLTETEFQKLLTIVVDEWFKDLLILAVTTGMRRGELLSLTWSDVKLTDKLIRVQSNGVFRTKAGKMRWIPLNGSAYAVLAKRATKKVTENVFDLKGNALSPSLVTHKFTKAVRAAGLDGKIHFHSLRHTFASWLVQNGSSIYEIQKLLGHSSSKIGFGSLIREPFLPLSVCD